jgi:hypothetical protein
MFTFGGMFAAIICADSDRLLRQRYALRISKKTDFTQNFLNSFGSHFPKLTSAWV